MSQPARVSRFLTVLAALVGAASTVAAPMAGTLVVLAGEVSISRSAGAARRVPDYARLEQGDQITLDTDSRARVSLFDSRSMVLLPGETYRVERSGITRYRDGVGVQVLPFSVPLGTTGRARQFDVDVGGAGTLQATGEVWVRPNTSQEWIPVGRDREALLHDWVRTGTDGRVVVVAGPVGVVFVEPDSLVQVQGREVVLEYGAVLMRARRRSDTVQVHTAELRVESTGGIVRVVRDAEAGTRVASFGHRAIVHQRQGRQRLAIHPGMLARVGPDGALLGTESVENARTVRDWRIELREKLDNVPRALGERLGALQDLLALVHRADDVEQPLTRTVRQRAALGLDAPAEAPASPAAPPREAIADASRPPRLAPTGLPEGAVRAPAPFEGHAARVTAPTGSVLGPARPELGGEASPLMKAPEAVSFDSPGEAPAALAAPGAIPPRPTPSSSTVKAAGDWVVQVETGGAPDRSPSGGIRTLAQNPQDPEPGAPPRRRRRRRNPWDAAPSPKDGVEAGPIAQPEPMPRPAIPEPIVTEVSGTTSSGAPWTTTRTTTRTPTSRAPTPTRAPNRTPTRTETTRKTESPPAVAVPSRPSFGSDPLGGPSNLARAFQL